MDSTTAEDFKVNSPVQKWSHQIAGIEFLNTHPASLLNCVMGGGKSFMAIQNIRHVAAHPGAKTLILCPAAVLGVWLREFWKHADKQFDVLILDSKSNSAKKAEMIYEALKLQQSHRRPLVIVLNYESFWRPEVFKVLMSCRFDKIVLDEIHRIKSHSAQCSKSAWKLGKNTDSRTGLTGTFLPNTPGDCFAQFRFLDDSIFGRYWTHFKAQYAIMDRYIPQKVSQWVNLEDMQRKIDRIMFQIGSEVLVLPERQDIQIEVSLSPAGRKVYSEMRKESIAFIKRSMEGSDDGDVRTAIGSNGAVQFLRLLQIANGYVTDDEGVEVITDTEKRRVLLDMLQDIDEPVVVFGYFKHDLAIVEKCAAILGRRYGEISGRRKDLTPHATYPEDIDIMGVQAKSGSAGIDLTRARIGFILNSGLLSPGDHSQMLARMHRPGQLRPVTYYTLVTKNTVETKLIDERGRKRDIVDVLLSELKEEDVF